MNQKRQHENSGGATLHSRLRNAVLSSVSPNARKARMADFVKLMNLQPGMRVIDLGGSTKLWKLVDVPLHITILNLSQQLIHRVEYGDHTFDFVDGDATDVALPDNSFDIVFSNSVIEHVGGPDKRKRFADEARRLAPGYFIQTPEPSFPLEAHTMLPLWWSYPQALKNVFIKQWRKSRPGYADFINTTAGVKMRELVDLFPDGINHKEVLLGFVKSNTMYRLGR